MRYMTMIHEMLQQRPQTHEQLRKSRKLLSTVELYAKELKANHQAWKEMLSQIRPESDEHQISSEALEIALKEMDEHLPSDSQAENEPQVLDAAMMFLRRRTPHA